MGQSFKGSPRLDIVPIDELRRRSAAARTVSTVSFPVIEVFEQVRLVYPQLTRDEQLAVVDGRCKYSSPGEAAYAWMTGTIGDPKLARVLPLADHFVGPGGHRFIAPGGQWVTSGPMHTNGGT